jgi:hypothetical protein
MRKSAKRSAVIATVAAVAVGGFGVTAWAAGWFATGTATGTAQSEDIKPLSATIVLNGKIYPGATRTATVKVNNPNEFKVALDTASAPIFTVKKVPGGADNSACASTLTPAIISLGNPSGSTTIGGQAVEQPISLPVTVSPNLDAACASSEVTMSMTFGGHATA